MDHSSGYGTNGVPFEYTVAEAKSKTLLFKKLTLIFIYCLWVGGWLLVGLNFSLIVPFLALIPLSLWILVFFTWRMVQVEYEYSYFSGVLTVCKILGSRSRKKLAEITIRNISVICPCDEEHATRVDSFREDKTVFAASSTQSPDLYAALWTTEEGVKQALFFEPNEKALKILKYYNASAFSRAAKF